jgi:hypothetical protein
MIKGEGMYPRKPRHVLGSYRNRNDIVLWWRPHPFGESAYASMRPQLLEEYKEIVEGYKKEGWGIYDDTQDPHRAMAWTDAYYGDWSSLICMYMVTGKPAVLQIAHYADEDVCAGDITASFTDICFDNDGVCWAYTPFFNGLFRLDLAENRAHYVTKDESEFDIINPALIYNHGDLLTILPLCLKHILQYNTVTNDLRKIPIEKEYSREGVKTNDYNLNSVIKNNDRFYICNPCSGVIIV